MMISANMLKERYEVRSDWERPGSGSVVMAFDHALGSRRVAIKIMEGGLPGPQVRADDHAGFHHRARQLVRLDHPGLATVSDFFVEGHRLFLVMDWIEGESLEHAPRMSVDPLQDTIRWINEIGSALEYLHKQNPPVLFLALDPSHVVVDQCGRARLVNFGISRTLPPSQYLNTPSRKAGSTHFWAPELRNGGTNPDIRSDIYSLGATMFALLAGRPPGVAQDGPRGSQQQASLRTYNPRVNPELERIIMQAMAPNRADRHHGVRQFLDQMARATGRPPAPPGRHRPIPKPVTERSQDLFDDPSLQQELEQPDELVADAGLFKSILMGIGCGVGIAAGVVWYFGLANRVLPPSLRSPASVAVATAEPTPVPQAGGARNPAQATRSDATITVHFSPPGATVYVDGRAVPKGKSPVSVLVPPGKHLVVVKMDGYVPAPRPVRWIDAGTTKAVTADLERPGAAPAPPIDQVYQQRRQTLPQPQEGGPVPPVQPTVPTPPPQPAATKAPEPPQGGGHSPAEPQPSQTSRFPSQEPRQEPGPRQEPAPKHPETTPTTSAPTPAHTGSVLDAKSSDARVPGY